MMGSYKEVEGDLIVLAKERNFDAIAHGCNCFCRMKRGIAPLMAEAFGCDKFPLESAEHFGHMKKLGNLDYQYNDKYNLAVVNAYTQYKWETDGKPFDYEAFTICMRKMNHLFRGRRVGLPKIGSHLAGGDWIRIKDIIQKELHECHVTVVIYKQS